MTLADELKTDPAGRGYAAHLPDDPQRAVDLLTAFDFTMVKAITPGLALTWAASGPMAAIVDTGNTSGHPARASCLAFLHSLNGTTTVDLADAKVRAAFEGWLAVGVIGQADYDALMAMATQPSSRAEVLGIPAPSARDIIDAWEAA